jgi:UDP-glucose 4-epimerase
MSGMTGTNEAGGTSGLRLLVTGGAGYIGSVVTAQLIQNGHQVVVLDDLSTGYADAVPDGATFRRGSIRDAEAVLRTGIDAVLHFAAKSLVGESVAHPDRYWDNNLGGTLALLEAMRVAGTRKIVFSSTASVYGEPERIPITEADPVRPKNPYGESKAAVDTALTEYARMHQIGAVSLRYFNVAGAYQDASGTWRGERHDPETHLVPAVLAAASNDEKFRLFGDDYPTPDGTCIRDYVHVTDLARAHLLALDATAAGRHAIYNMGSGTGYSNRQVLDACQEVTGLDIPVQVAPRRPGDPARLVASSEAIAADLGWRPERDLRTMVADAWTFTQLAR